MRLGILLGVSALILLLAIPAYAETQNVKVSGDITVRGIYRDQFDLNDADAAGNEHEADSDNFVMSTVELQVDADLSENVSTCIRLVNQRNWGDGSYPGMYDDTNVDQRFWKSRLVEVGVDLAYVTLKEMIFEPVTVRIGRQDLWLGRGFIIGANQRDPGLIKTNIHGGLAMRPIEQDQRAIGSPELTAYNSFDAVRTTIDFEKYAPFVMDAVYAKVDEGMIGPEEDIDLYGVNAGYTFNVYNAEAEAYYWFKDDASSPAGQIAGSNEVHTIGTRGSFQPTSEWEFAGEVAYQFGKYIDPRQTNALGTLNSQQTERDRSAWACDVSTEYKGWMERMWSPKVGAEYIYYSGEDNVGSVGGQYQGWDRMFTARFPTAIRPWLGLYYLTDRAPNGEDSGFINQHQIVVSGSVQPLDDITFEAKGAYFWLAEKADLRNYGRANNDFGDLGSELNLITTYDYTEDVTFSLLTGWFFPGAYYDSPGIRRVGSAERRPDLDPKTATEVIGSMKVSF